MNYIILKLSIKSIEKTNQLSVWLTRPCLVKKFSQLEDTHFSEHLKDLGSHEPTAASFYHSPVAIPLETIAKVYCLNVFTVLFIMCLYTDG